ncbi:formylglycine-generating enzyme family protein [Rhodoferax sp. GW822-FHT02A01]|uniref:formylglycine-generating enzyme family protein n=1 Tax=Rhodoferax sp. GW822-FHT02A01 TaxID=3141537 RepID=UPI00315D4DA4
MRPTTWPALLLILVLSACTTRGGPDAAHTAFTNSVGLRMVRIPAGEFLMGSDEPAETLHKSYPLAEQKRLDDLFDEAPVHRVRITKAFYMGATEVTVGQFRQFVEQSGYVPESIADGTGGYGYNPQYDASKTQRGDAFEGRDTRYSWQNPGFAQTDQHPVVNVTWNDAQALAQWLSKQEGRSYRIPTEAEWEYAARAGTRTRYHCGDEPTCLLKVANTFDEAAKPYWPQFAANALNGNDGFAFTAPVASFAPNAFGLYDMHGNAWEWTQDLYAEDYYAHAPVDDPKGPEEGNVYVRRGGSWHTWALYARSSYRNWNSPQTRYTLVGIRLVMDAP